MRSLVIVPHGKKGPSQGRAAFVQVFEAYPPEASSKRVPSLQRHESVTGGVSGANVRELISSVLEVVGN